MGAGRLLGCSHNLLGGCRKRFSPFSLRRRGGTLRPSLFRFRSGGLPGLALGFLPVVSFGGAGFPGLPMGQPAFGSRAFDGFRHAPPMAPGAGQPPAVLRPHSFPLPVALVPAGVRVGHGETHQRRPHLEELDRPGIPLLDPAHPPPIRLVHKPTAGLVPKTFLPFHVRSGTARAFFDFRTPQTAALGLPVHSLPPSLYPGHGQLLLFQLPHAGTLLFRPGGRGLARLVRAVVGIQTGTRKGARASVGPPGSSSPSRRWRSI